MENDVITLNMAGNSKKDNQTMIISEVKFVMARITRVMIKIWATNSPKSPKINIQSKSHK